ncbi:Serine protease precursor MucD/AlgY associated with sigma factor RpoE [hydrothermal vent metagenome]|uniref:Serine protease MucD/AlgY associated with sigma factor RpoE n=1 Tax=hydrothermal vent metagenome TaxID=652676 RepID=A0A3B1D748_9ZZZZ
MNKFLKLAISFLFTFFISSVEANMITDEAQRLYQDHQANVYQIQVVDKATGKKSAIGSGFRISAQGHIATNFHVVSLAVNKPKSYRVEFVREDNTVGPLEILHIDVVHDLAVVKSHEASNQFMTLAGVSLSKGTRIFSMGNPHDLGMTIVEGTYNGWMKNSFYKKILFSGSINPGMSGGPALNHAGEVIGINVATAGDQLSFLVPVEYLKALYAKVVENPFGISGGWKADIEKQLVENQDDYMKRVMESVWDNMTIGDAIVPGKISKAFKCWGDSKDIRENLYSHSYMDCATDDQLYLSPTLQTGQIHYRYNWLISKGLNAIRFYNLYELYFSNPRKFGNAAKYDVTNFVCQNDFVSIDGKDWKATLCVRNYKKYTSLYDINLSMASVHAKDRGFIVDVVAMGLTKSNAMQFIQKFMKAIQWIKP